MKTFTENETIFRKAAGNVFDTIEYHAIIFNTIILFTREPGRKYIVTIFIISDKM